MKSELKRRWGAARNREDIFIKRNQKWLEGTFEYPRVKVELERPGKTFEESSERSKRRKTEKLRSSVNRELIFAARTKLRTSEPINIKRYIIKI